MDVLFSDALSEDPKSRIMTTVIKDRKVIEIRAHSTTQEAGRYCQAARIRGDLYYGIGLQPDTLPEFQRGGKETVTALAGFVLDFDCDSENGKKTFSSKEEAIEFINSPKIPLDPTMIVDSGGGYHVYWLFEEPWYFESDEERSLAERMWKGYHRYIQQLAPGGLDSTFTTDRVWRILGSINHKIRGGQRDVTLFRKDETSRYSPYQHFDHYKIDETQENLVEEVVDYGDLDLSVSAGVPLSCMRLMAMSREFSDVWWHREPLREPGGEISGDQSQSRYDWHIGIAGKKAGWTPQEIAQSMFQNRILHGAVEKKSEKYWPRTLRGLGILVRNQPDKEEESKDEEEEDTLMRRLARVTRIPLRGVFTIGAKTKADSTNYYIDMGDSDFEVGKVNQFTSAKHWRTIRLMLNPLGDNGPIDATIFRTLILQALNEIEDRTDALDMPVPNSISKVEEFSRRVPATDKSGVAWDDMNGMLMERQEFKKGGYLYVNKAGLKAWLELTDKKITIHQTQLHLEQAGFEPETIKYKDDSEKTRQVTYYRGKV